LLPLAYVLYFYAYLKSQQMHKIIELRFVNDYYKTEEFINRLNNEFSPIIDLIYDQEFFEKSIKAIIITDDFHNDYEKTAREFNVNSQISRERGFVVASKILFNHKFDSPEYYIFYPAYALFNVDTPLLQMVLEPILNISSNKILPKAILTDKFTRAPLSLDDYIKFAACEWCKAAYTFYLLSNFDELKLRTLNHNSLLTSFKRKLKKSLFEYNGDQFDHQGRINTFWDNYWDSIKVFFLRLIENQHGEPKDLIMETESIVPLIKPVIDEIVLLTNNCLQQKDFDVKNLKQAIINFSTHFEVHLEEQSDGLFFINLTKNPKDYFIDELIETEPRIVCFMDILGFSEQINEYDSDLTSTLLQDIHESFSIAKNKLLEHKFQQNNEAIKHLKYHTFSDNICISIPYFDNENDFLTNFNLLSVYVRGFQLIMMTKGIFMRGGISIGSYYSDNNIIFSKGLVNAYHLESKKANYPRVIIDNAIISKLFKYDEKRIKFFVLDKTIIFDWENIAFLNPFGLAESSVQQMQSVFNELHFEDDDPLSRLAHSLTKSIGEMSIGLFKMISEKEKEGLKPIKDKIIENIYFYQQNENIVSKYYWLFEFLKWLEKDDSGRLRFQYLSEFLKEPE
jgi:hypothetical protein